MPQVQFLTERLQQQGPAADVQHLLGAAPHPAAQQQVAGVQHRGQVPLAQRAGLGHHPAAACQGGQKIAGVQIQQSAAGRQLLLRVPGLHPLPVQSKQFLHVQAHRGGRVPAILPVPGDDAVGGKARGGQLFAQRVGGVFQRAGGVGHLVILPEGFADLFVGDRLVGVQKQKRQQFPGLVDPGAPFQQHRIPGFYLQPAESFHIQQNVGCIHDHPSRIRAKPGRPDVFPWLRNRCCR